jgi:hypothetical protein
MHEVESKYVVQYNFGGKAGMLFINEVKIGNRVEGKIKFA